MRKGMLIVILVIIGTGLLAGIASVYLDGTPRVEVNWSGILGPIFVTIVLFILLLLLGMAKRPEPNESNDSRGSGGCGSGEDDQSPFPGPRPGQIEELSDLQHKEREDEALINVTQEFFVIGMKRK